MLKGGREEAWTRVRQRAHAGIYNTHALVLHTPLALWQAALLISSRAELHAHVTPRAEECGSREAARKVEELAASPALHHLPRWLWNVVVDVCADSGAAAAAAEGWRSAWPRAEDWRKPWHVQLVYKQFF